MGQNPPFKASQVKIKISIAMFLYGGLFTAHVAVGRIHFPLAVGPEFPFSCSARRGMCLAPGSHPYSPWSCDPERGTMLLQSQQKDLSPCQIRWRLIEYNIIVDVPVSSYVQASFHSGAGTVCKGRLSSLPARLRQSRAGHMQKTVSGCPEKIFFSHSAQPPTWKMISIYL